MVQDMDLKKIERRVWMRYFQDGLWDIYFGLMFLGFALASVFDDIGEGFAILIYLGIFSVAYAVFWLGKRLITFPRIGRVKFGLAVKKRRIRASVVLAVSVLTGAALYTPIAFDYSVMEWVRASYGAPIAANFVIVFSALAYFLRFPRLYVYGLLLGAAIPTIDLLRERTDIPFPALVAFGAAGGVVLLVGLVVLARFLHANPRPAVEVSDGNG